MKIIFSILAICFCVPLGCEMEKEAGSNPKDPLNAETKRKKSDVELNDYKGRVKIVKEFMFALEEIAGAPAFTNVVEISRYDEKGREVEWLHEPDGEKFTNRFTFKYDEKGNIIKEINESVELHSIYKYDGNGKCLEIEQRNSVGKVIGKNIFKYDGKGNKVKETWHEPRTVNGETRFVPILGTSWEFTYWN